MFDEKGRFIQEDYQKQAVFSSFLPGISGIRGIPMWCFYVNRGQGVVSFGTETKDQSIMEFRPAHQSYQMVSTLGFRTFLKVDGKFYEPFSMDELKPTMFTDMNSMEIEEIHEEMGLRVNVKYHTLPEEKLGGLIRTLTLTNLESRVRTVEVLDGMPEVIPFSIDLKDLKEMGQTMKAWMGVEGLEENLPYFRVASSTKDSAQVEKIQGGHYYFALGPDLNLLPIISDASLIFGYDVSYAKPLNFVEEKLKDLLEKKQRTRNIVPSAFAGFMGKISPNSAITITSIAGMTKNKENLKEFALKTQSYGYLEDKKKENEMLTTDLTKVIASKTGHKIFDEYAKQTYLDNVMRGGYPYKIGNKIIHIYSRKHGDIERDYNYFKISPEYFSQGNGNFRDVNQNRRSDVRFHPYVKEANIKTFYNLIQMDGYNPLLVLASSYKLDHSEDVLCKIPGTQRNLMREFFKNEFSPGSLLGFLESEKIQIEVPAWEFLFMVMEAAKEIQNAEFGEGYWTDHWVYNLDLIESYLSIYPDLEKELLFKDFNYTYYYSGISVLPRTKRYVNTEDGIRQYKALDKSMAKLSVDDQLRCDLGQGAVYRSSLIAKLMVLLVNKFTSLDMDGRGIEMEAGKPGWYDALNGLPGLMGSSMAESCELMRLMNFMANTLECYHEELTVPLEVYEMMKEISRVLQIYNHSNQTKFWVWNELNTAKETFREKTKTGIKGEEKTMTTRSCLLEITPWKNYLEEGIDEAVKENGGICPTYYRHEMTKFTKLEEEIVAKEFKKQVLPLFLEGPVKYFKLIKDQDKKKEMYHLVKSSGLFDEKLSMYKVNASLEKVPFEVGRAKAFTPGWLENESVWLHMEYKYLLELLKQGLYEEFFYDFKTMGIPFLDAKIYGRSLLENSSFIASSENPDPSVHGRGFIARLSGSTAEFLEMWQIMMFGQRNFLMEEELVCSFNPSLPEYLIPDDLIIEATFLGNTKVKYHLKYKKALIPGEYTLMKYILTYGNEKVEKTMKSIRGEAAHDLREGKILRVDIYIQ